MIDADALLSFSTLIGASLTFATVLLAWRLLRRTGTQPKRKQALSATEIPSFTQQEIETIKRKRDSFLRWMNDEGFAVIKLDPKMEKKVTSYWNICGQFFNRDADYKSQFKGVPKYKDEIFENKRQVNKGYLTVDEKEFLKLSLVDPSQRIPEDIEAFPIRFRKICEALEETATCLFRVIAGSHNRHTKKAFYNAADADTVAKFFREGSSVSMINYHPISRDAAKSTDGRDHPTDQSHFPSATHQDTGFLTMIVCSTVPALEIQDRVTGEWFMPEKSFEPHKYAFLIIGKKLPRLADQHSDSTKERFLPTVHRVALPYDTQRYSLLYFQDIPS